jgi:hypothetical protein
MWKLRYLLSVAALALFSGFTIQGPGAEFDWLSHPVNQWVRQSPAADEPTPGFVYEGGGAYDPDGDMWIHHAGHDGIPQGFHTFTFDFAARKWQQKFPPTSPPGVCCVDGSFTFDVANRRFVRFPGGSLGHGFQWSRGVRLKESAVWLYDPAENTWSNMRPPPYAQPEEYSRDVVGGLCSGAVYDPNHGVVLTFGGQSAGGGKNALFAYDAYANKLDRIEAANPPEPRDGMGLAYDTRHDKLVMFGSQYLVDHRTWVFDLQTSRWEALDLAPHPPAEKVTKDYCTIPRLAYDSIHGVVLCLAWLGEDGHETWALDLGRRQWTKMNPAAEPGGSKSRSRNLAFDARRNVFILETSSAKTNRPEIWTYRYRGATGNNIATCEAPHNVQLVTDAGGKAQLNWTASSTAEVTEYRVYRGAGEDSWRVQLEEIATTRDTEFHDKRLRPGQVYWYAVKAVGKGGALSPMSNRARTQPRVMDQPVVSVLDQNRIEVKWARHPAADVIGYNLYRGVAKVKALTKGTPAAWRDNDPEYPEPKLVQVRDIVKLQRLNEAPLTDPQFVDQFNLSSPGRESGDYKYAVLAYVVRAVNKHGCEGGPSPFALTIPSEPKNVLCREASDEAELKWDRNLENGIAGYHVYKLKGTWEIVRVTERPIEANTFRHRPGDGPTRYWIVAVDALGQEGQPSSPAWFRHSYRDFFAGDWHQ